MKDAIAKFKAYLIRRYPDRSTTKHYMSDLAIFSQFVGDKGPKDISPKLIDDFVQAQSQQGLKAATINRRLSAISSLFEFLISETEDDNWHNPVSWKRHSIRPGRHLPRDITTDCPSLVSESTPSFAQCGWGAISAEAVLSPSAGRPEMSSITTYGCPAVSGAQYAH